MDYKLYFTLTQRKAAHRIIYGFTHKDKIIIYAMEKMVKTLKNMRTFIKLLAWHIVQICLYVQYLQRDIDTIMHKMRTKKARNDI